jgi:hypothetical protein
MDEEVVVATFAHRHEAEFAQATLESAGIESMVLADDAGGAWAGLSLSGAIRVIVNVEDLEEAKRLLDESAGGDTSEAGTPE